MPKRTGLWIKGRGAATSLVLALLLISGALIPDDAKAQSDRPRDRIHASVTLGSCFLIGVGYTHWVERHHALEFTAFPFARPGEGFPFGLRVGHAWIPSDENWRAKLGANVTLMVSPSEEGWDRFTPILALTPGLQYEPDSQLSVRGDLWLSYFPTEGVFAPSAVEILSAWRN